MLELIAKLQLLVSLLTGQQLQPPTQVGPIYVPAEDVDASTEMINKNRYLSTVSVTSLLNVRESYGLTSKVLGQQPVGSQGTVLSIEPHLQDGYSWIPVDFNTGRDGWVAEPFLAFTRTADTPKVSEQKIAEIIAKPPVKSVSNSRSRNRIVNTSESASSTATSTASTTPVVASNCSLKVLTPNGNESFEADEPIAVTWSGNNNSSSTDVIVSLIQNGVVAGTYSVLTTNDGTLTFSIGADLSTGSNYKVRVRDSGDSSCSDASNETFTVFAQAATSQCTIPNLTFDPADFDQVIDDFEATSTISLTGSGWNNTLIRNCYVHDTGGDGIVLRDVENVVITGCRFENIGGQAAVRGSISGGTSGVTLYKNVVDTTAMNGFNFGQRVTDGVNHSDLNIIDNTINQTGLMSSDGSTHALYIQAQDFEIIGNTITGTRDGNAISVRSSGEVSCNTISGTSKADKPGIRYYSDHQVGISNQLLINGNKVRGSKSGINLFVPVDRYDGSTPNSHVVKNFTITNNDVRGNDTPIVIDDRYQSSPFFLTISDNLIE